MNYFIFQGNPDHFDIDTYVEQKENIKWSVRQRKKDIHVGDKVFLWRASGSKKVISGVIAVAVVTEEPKIMKDEDASRSLWHIEGADGEALRVTLRIEKKCIKPKEVVKKDWIVDDPILKDLQILKARTGTNFLISTEQGNRLDDLCRNTGRDWTYEESLAGLWAFKETYGKEISKLPDSPVAEVALKIGRAVSGVYNKVMNFRAIDPNDSRKGFTSTNNIDRKVWANFYLGEKKALDVVALDHAFNKFWGDSSCASEQYDNKDEISVYSWKISNKSMAVKMLDKSAFLHHGTAIPKQIRDFFVVDHMSSGDKIPVLMRFGYLTFDAHIEMDIQEPPRTRLIWRSDFSNLLRSQFPAHFKHFDLDERSAISTVFMRFTREKNFNEYRITFLGKVSNDVIKEDILADEIEDRGPSKEGALKEYYGKRYERDPSNRKRAIEIHGLNCKVCDFNFEAVYGQRGADFIEVHHRKPIAHFEGEEQAVDPATDLVPVCSNCHRMIHRRADQILTVEELQEFYFRMKNDQMV